MHLGAWPHLLFFLFLQTLGQMQTVSPWDISSAAMTDSFLNFASILTSTVNVRFWCQFRFRIEDEWPLTSFCTNIQQSDSEKYIIEEAEIKCLYPACNTAQRHVLSRGLDSYFYWTGGPFALPPQSLELTLLLSAPIACSWMQQVHIRFLWKAFWEM